MMRILLLVLAFGAACAGDPDAPQPAETVVETAPEEAKTAVTTANEANLFVGKLHWGKDPATGKPWTGESLRRLEGGGSGPVARNVRLVLAKADQALRTPPKVVLPDDLFHYAFCARIATGDKQASCKKEFRAAYFGTDYDPGMGIVTRMRPADYPVEQASAFQALIRAVDLFFPLMTLDEKSETRVWLHAFADVDLGKKPETWRMTTKLTAAVLLEDERLERAVEAVVKSKAAQDWLPPGGWKPDRSCRNNRSEKNYGGKDFRQRDALLFHVYNLQAWTMLVQAKTSAVDAAGQAAIQRGFEFLKPYYTGKKAHREFVCTSVAADRSLYRQQRWKRDGARTMLRMAEPLYPAIRPWAKPALDENHAPALKLVAALQAAK